MMDPDDRLPAEWEPQRALLMAWPYTGSDWQPILNDIRTEYSMLIHQVLRYLDVILLIHPDDSDTKEPLGQLPGLEYLEIPFNDTWCRDYGPLTMVNENGLIALDFYFNGWGGRHDARLDNQVNSHLVNHSRFVDIRFRQSLLELEGGAIDSDGCGHILINRYCMRKRLGHLNDESVDLELRDWLGADKILAIDIPPLDGDETDSHIDTLARFTRPGQVAFQTLSDTDRNRTFLDQLRALRDSNSSPFELIALPDPDDLAPGLPASYANFVLINDAVLVPQYGSMAADYAAIRIFEQIYPERAIEGVQAQALIQQGGGPHCACMQIPG